MDHLEKLEWLLGFALQCLDDAAGEVRDASELDTQACLKHIGAAIVSAWDLRDKVHSIRPSLRPDFVAHHAACREEYERYDQIVGDALISERNGDSDNAAALWAELLSDSVPSHFRVQAQAGMYRASARGS